MEVQVDQQRTIKGGGSSSAWMKTSLLRPPSSSASQYGGLISSRGLGGSVTFYSKDCVEMLPPPTEDLRVDGLPVHWEEDRCHRSVKSCCVCADEMYIGDAV
ncbi:rna-dependent rna polymerase rdp, partial [Cystoisospora suis]